MALMERDGLNVVEDELLSMLKDAHTLVVALKDLPEKESVAVESVASVISRLERVQDGLLDNIHLLRDYLPYERSTTLNRLRARQARADLTSVCGALENMPDEYDAAVDDEENASSSGGGDEQGGTGGSGQDKHGFSPERPAKRVRTDG